jgi:VWFA-related protein
MTRGAPIAAVGIVLSAVSLVAHQDTPTPSVQEARPAFRAEAEAVAVDVAVRQRGRPVTGLGVEDFAVLDNGVPQTIVDFSYERLPIDVTVAFDISASVTSRLLDQLYVAVQQLRQDLGRTDRLRLLTFNHRVRRAVDVTDAPAAIDTAFERIRTGGSSAIFDSIAVALAAPASADRRHLVVVFSDGQDTSSVNTPAVLLDIVRRTTPAVHIVLPMPVPTPGSPFALFRPATDNSREMFLDVAAESGGLVVAMGARESLPGAFRRAFTEFRSSYVLHFVPTGVERRGVHQITVRVKRDNVDVRARREYVRK